MELSLHLYTLQTNEFYLCYASKQNTFNSSFNFLISLSIFLSKFLRTIVSERVLRSFHLSKKGISVELWNIHSILYIHTTVQHTLYFVSQVNSDVWSLESRLCCYHLCTIQDFPPCETPLKAWKPGKSKVMSKIDGLYTPVPNSSKHPLFCIAFFSCEKGDPSPQLHLFLSFNNSFNQHSNLEYYSALTVLLFWR